MVDFDIFYITTVHNNNNLLCVSRDPFQHFHPTTGRRQNTCFACLGLAAFSSGTYIRSLDKSTQRVHSPNPYSRQSSIHHAEFVYCVEGLSSFEHPVITTKPVDQEYYDIHREQKQFRGNYRYSEESSATTDRCVVRIVRNSG